MASRTLSMIAVVSLSLFACGDDDDTGGGGETESSSTGDATGTQMTTTTMSATTMAMDGSSTGGGDTSGSDTGPADSGDATGGSGSGSGPMPMTDSGSETGVPGECPDLDMKACEMNEGCLWVGNANNGMCVGAGVRACELLLTEMICGMHPECMWDKAKMTCAGA